MEFQPTRIERKKGTTAPYKVDLELLETITVGGPDDDDILPILQYANIPIEGRDDLFVVAVIDHFEMDGYSNGGAEVWYVWDSTEAYDAVRNGGGAEAAEEFNTLRYDAVRQLLEERLSHYQQKYEWVNGYVSLLEEDD